MAKLPAAISKLSDDDYDFMVKLVTMGRGDSDVAAALQDRGAATHVKEETLAKAIGKWRKNRGQEMIIKSVADKMTTVDGRLRKQLDVMNEMTEACEWQRARVTKVMQQEEGKPLPLKMVTEELKVWYTMLNQLAKLQLDTGILRRVHVGESAEDYAEFEEVESVDDSEGFTREDMLLLESMRQELEELGDL